MASRIVSIEHTLFVVEGLVIQGYSSDADALMPEIEGITVDRGAQGSMVAYTTADYGGPVTIKLQPTSPSLKQLFAWSNQYQPPTGMAVLPRHFEAYMLNIPLGFKFTFHGGLMTRWPGGLTMGKGSTGTFNFMWEFEDIKRDMDKLNVADAFRLPGDFDGVIEDFPFRTLSTA